MKIYFIDKTGKYVGIANRINEKGFENLEIKDTYLFRCTKNDFVVLCEYNKYERDNEVLKKYNNLIIITDDIKKETVCEHMKNYNVADIIDSKSSKDYVAQRILNSIKSGK